MMSTKKLVPFLALAALARADIFSDSFCKGDLCITAVYDNGTSSVNYTAVASGKVGWIGVGQGEQMAGANMMVGWAQPGGTVVLSQRSTASHIAPTTQIQAEAFVPDRAASTSNASITVLRWAFPVRAGFATESTAHIWATSPTSPNSADPSAIIDRHNKHGLFDLDLTKPVPTSAIPIEVPFSAGGRRLPTGSKPGLPGQHNDGTSSGRPNSGSSSHLGKDHKRLGLVMVSLVLVQACSGQIDVAILRSPGVRYPHIFLGIVLGLGLVLAIPECG
ncbi:unnamed protein product [Tilletia controversa]|uniref:DOMON domain-containing protein n=3 Tax=Tilletia TaxID=13289 RepID=A0A8X7MP33_9BASI|nr:hypothetical protein CF328_g7382 [Tilletia controversa]KAE8242823.1 hypothetical protein A4X06_0g6743 [Tilletia controversa]CAD6932425.1 unnamed protein product [Tilletia controversa]CAD7064498.1 unnamed protein product [Tilletia caries]